MFKKLALALDASVVALGKATLDVANVLLGTQEEPEKEPDIETKLAKRHEELLKMKDELVTIANSISRLAASGHDVRYMQAHLETLIAAYEVQKAAYISVADAHVEARDAEALRQLEVNTNASLAALSKSLNVSQE
jgi:hypothetical protein